MTNSEILSFISKINELFTDKILDNELDELTKSADIDDTTTIQSALKTYGVAKGSDISLLISKLPQQSDITALPQKSDLNSLCKTSHLLTLPQKSDFESLAKNSSINALPQKNDLNSLCKTSDLNSVCKTSDFQILLNGPSSLVSKTNFDKTVDELKLLINDIQSKLSSVNNQINNIDNSSNNSLIGLGSQINSLSNQLNNINTSIINQNTTVDITSSLNGLSINSIFFKNVHDSLNNVLEEIPVLCGPSFSKDDVKFYISKNDDSNQGNNLDNAALIAAIQNMQASITESITSSIDNRFKLFNSKINYVLSALQNNAMFNPDPDYRACMYNDLCRMCRLYEETNYCYA